MERAIELRDDESLDDLCLSSMKIIQPKNGYRFSLEAVLLANAVSLLQVQKIVDLGCGNAILSLILAHRKPSLKITGFDIQEKMLERASRSVKYNQLENNISFIHGDVKRAENILAPGSADLVVCNPPFWRKGEGKLSNNHERQGARHEIWAELDDFIRAAAHVLKPKGIMAMIQRADRLSEILASISTTDLSVQKVRMVHSYTGSEAKLALVFADKGKTGQSLKVLAPLIIYDEPNRFSAEIFSYYGV